MTTNDELTDHGAARHEMVGPGHEAWGPCGMPELPAIGGMNGSTVRSAGFRTRHSVQPVRSFDSARRRGVFPLALTYERSVAVTIGFLALAGVVAETGVVMLVYPDRAWAERREASHTPGMRKLYAAIMEGAVERVRLKTMTVASTMLGLLPIIWGTGTGASIMKRIAGADGGADDSWRRRREPIVKAGRGNDGVTYLMPGEDGHVLCSIESVHFTESRPTEVT